LDDITCFQNRAILTTKNSIVEKINKHMLDMIPGEEKVYLSYDSTIKQGNSGDAIETSIHQNFQTLLLLQEFQITS
jgi:hypothetical protein